MLALALTPGTDSIALVNRKEPEVCAPDEVKLRVGRVGVCGTDREEAAGGRARAPDGSTQLILGHEMIGQVTAIGAEVTRVKPGDHAVCTVRRGCGNCLPCAMNRSDMCLTGEYRERGIWRLDGYQCEYVVDREQYVVRVPDEIEPVGVLTEPMSVATKAIWEAVRIQSARLPDAPATPNWLYGRRCLVAGLGPVGLLAALALHLRGASVVGLDIVDPDNERAQWLPMLGGTYVDGRTRTPSNIGTGIGSIDLIFDATGVASLELNLLDALGTNGVYVVTGIPPGEKPITVNGAPLIRSLVLQNKLMLGSVNAARDHYESAIEDLTLAWRRWGDKLSRLITHRYQRHEFAKALARPAGGEIKAVVEWR